MVVGEEGTGKTTLLTSWVQYHSTACTGQPDLVIWHSVRPDACESSYAGLIYRVCSELRRRLNIPRRPHLSEAGLRLYFGRWLEMTHNRLVELGSGKCIIVLDGVDQLRTGKDSEEIADWLPLATPARVRILVSLGPNSLSFRYLSTCKVQRIPLPDEDFLSKPLPPGRTLADRIRTLVVINESEYPQEVLRTVACALICTHRGLYKEEFSILCPEMTKLHWSSLIALLDEFVVESDGLYMSNHYCFSRVIREIYSPGKDLHLQLFAAVSPICAPRESLERAYHMNMTGNLSRLKDSISAIESLVPFLLPEHKFQLSSYWQRLENACIDPVTELNSALEYFFSHSRPSSDVLFPLLTQFFIFFLEYSQLEVSTTPVFRHPPLKGATELKELHLLDEVQSMDMFAQGVTQSLAPEENFSPESEVGRTQAKASVRPVAPGPRYYHYKRWLWISFPWLYLNTEEDFSERMRRVRDLDAEMDYGRERGPVERLLGHFQQQGKEKVRVRPLPLSPKLPCIRSLPASPLKAHSRSVSLLPSPKSLYDTVKTKQLERDFAFADLACTSPLHILSQLDLKIRTYTHREIALIQRKNLDLVRRFNRTTNEL